MNKSVKRFGKTLMIGGAITAAGLASNEGLDRYEDGKIAGVDVSMDGSRFENVIPDENLKGEYQKVADARAVYSNIAGTRRSVSKIVRYLFGAVPGIAKSRLQAEPNFTFDQLESFGIQKETFSPLVDLGAFDLAKLRSGELDFNKLKEQKIKELVLMEDRDPQFFLNYEGFSENSVVPLNRHGEDSKAHPRDVWTMKDVKALVDGLHGAGIKAVIGFWANTGDKDKNAFIKRNWESVKPVIPTSDDMNFLSFVKDSNGKELPFASYIISQYSKINKDFGVDGLFLGDGFMGFRSFLDLKAPYDSSAFAPAVSDFYRRVHDGVHALDEKDTLWAYDCMGNGTGKSLKNGVDLKGISNHIDTYVFQSYGADAWGSGNLNLAGYTNERDLSELATLPMELRAKTIYTVGLGDRVEGWHGKPETIKAKQKALAPFAEKGTLGVWTTVPVGNLLR